MTPPARARPKLKLSEEPPPGRRALAFGALWLVLAVIVTWAMVWIVIRWTSSPIPRIAAALLLLALSTPALMLASDSGERWLTGQGRDLARAGRRVLRNLARGLTLGAAGALLSALCTAVVTTPTTNHTGAADAPARVETSVLLTVVLPVLVWFLGTGVVWLLFGRRHRAALKPHPRLRHGTHASALSICLVIGAAWIAAAGLAQHARGELSSGPRSTVPTVPVTDRQWSRQSPYLARKFEPQLWLTTRERWDPTSVTWYVKQNPTPNTDPPFCNAHRPGKPPRWAHGTHPVVFVARGSHADYPRPISVPIRQLRCSLWRDTNWGLDNNLSPLQIGRLRSSAGPPAPQHQGPWQTPFRSMLCSGRWLSIRGVPHSEAGWTCPSG